MKYDPRSEQYRLVANNDWQFQCVRLALTNRLILGDEGFFSRLGDLPAKVFNRWVSGALITKYNLPPESQMALYVITAYYFYAMCVPELRDVNVDFRHRFAPIVAKATSVPIEFVMDIADVLGPLRNATDLVHEMSTNSRQDRTGDLKFADLFLLLSTSWFGVNARENVGVALEHLPTFTAMLYMAFAERSYRKTVITQRAETLARGNEDRQFTDLVFKAVAEQFSNQV
ncbi:virion structural protein [Pseudomonas phage PhiPA3]|uniref:Virion structural protein n=1 Tax=Pseudomonas phage PhiPA3 TaxID=998086 RepID=F8SJP1_BPPA3|nr:virion structural protein [Pseudomonas phage PhiPA3]AEH03436.1 virion structural protein [Pseudomonas phage PhiPA3]